MPTAQLPQPQPPVLRRQPYHIPSDSRFIPGPGPPEESIFHPF